MLLKKSFKYEKRTYFNFLKLMYEVKNYRELVGASSSTHNYDEILKDIALMKNGEINKSVWVFVDKGPNSNMIKLLEENGIDYIVIQ